jgi:EmrB/QacA subfamily drug resistance transporter
VASLILGGGALGDRLGRKRVFMAGIGLFAVASVACGLSPSVNFLIAARVVQGIGGAMMIPGSLSIITVFFPEGSRGRAIGTWSAATTIVFILGPILGGVLTSAGLWRGVFLINPPIAILTLIVLYLKVPESRDQEAKRIDYFGALLITLGLAGLAYGFISAPDAGLGDPAIYLSLMAGGCLLAAFILYEWRSSHPMLPLGLFKSRVFSGANLLTLNVYGALSVATLFLPLNMVQVQGYTPAQAGLTFLPFTFILAAMSRWAGGVADRYGPRLLLAIGPLLVGVAFAMLALVGITTGPSSYWWTYLPGVLVFGIGMGLTVAPLTTTVMSAWPRYAGTESGINNAVARTAGVLTIAVLGSVALFTFAARLEANSQPIGLSPELQQELLGQASRLGDAEVPASVPASEAGTVQQAIRQSFVDTYRLVMLICAALAWLSVVMVLALIGRRKPASKE